MVPISLIILLKEHILILQMVGLKLSVGDNNSDGNNDTIIRHTEYMPAAMETLHFQVVLQQ